jgi:hypothetical protein
MLLFIWSVFITASVIVWFPNNYHMCLRFCSYHILSLVSYVLCLFVYSVYTLKLNLAPCLYKLNLSITEEKDQDKQPPPGTVDPLVRLDHG